MDYFKSHPARGLLIMYNPCKAFRWNTSKFIRSCVFPSCNCGKKHKMIAVCLHKNADNSRCLRSFDVSNPSRWRRFYYDHYTKDHGVYKKKK